MLHVWNIYLHVAYIPYMEYMGMLNKDVKTYFLCV